MIRVENLSKDYGAIRAIDRVSFTVQDGEILGFLGPNGAGKSTTLKIITTFLAPTEGKVTIDDLEVGAHSTEVRSRIGYLPELNPLYEDMVVFDQLQFAANVRGMSGRAYKDALERVIHTCGIGNVIHRPIGELSKGYHQRVGLAMAIIHNPDILILDEPSSGLDPNQIVEIRALIKELGKEKTVIMSTHILQEVQAVATRMVILNEGHVVADGTTAELMAGFHGQAQLTLEVKNATEDSIAALPVQFPSIKVQDQQIEDGVATIHLEYPTGKDLREQLFGYAVQSGWVLLEMSHKQAQLEDLFRSLTMEKGGARA